ncbi:hypothetical protein ACU4GI_11920 [Cupriavidus basilensis]
MRLNQAIESVTPFGGFDRIEVSVLRSDRLPEQGEVNVIMTMILGFSRQHVVP